MHLTHSWSQYAVYAGLSLTREPVLSNTTHERLPDCLTGFQCSPRRDPISCIRLDPTPTRSTPLLDLTSPANTSARLAFDPDLRITSALEPVQAEAEHGAERSSGDGSDAEERCFDTSAGPCGRGGGADPRAELETDLAVEALLAAAAEMGAGGPGGTAGDGDTTILQVAPLTTMTSGSRQASVNPSHCPVSAVARLGQTHRGPPAFCPMPCRQGLTRFICDKQRHGSTF